MQYSQVHAAGDILARPEYGQPAKLQAGAATQQGLEVGLVVARGLMVAGAGPYSERSADGLFLGGGQGLAEGGDGQGVVAEADVQCCTHLFPMLRYSQKCQCNHSQGVSTTGIPPL